MREKLTTASSLVAATAAVLASSCCGLPLMLTLLGVSGGVVGLLGPLQPFRGALLILAAALIAAGWVFTLRARSRAMNAAACPPGHFRTSFVVLGLASLLLVAAAAAPVWEPELTRLLLRRSG